MLVDLPLVTSALVLFKMLEGLDDALPSRDAALYGTVFLEAYAKSRLKRWHESSQDERTCIFTGCGGPSVPDTEMQYMSA